MIPKAYQRSVKGPHGSSIQCTLHGGVAEQFRYLKQTRVLFSASATPPSMLEDALAGVPNGEEWLLIALGHPDINTKVKYSQELIAAIWRADGGLGPYPLLDVLGDYERTNGVYYERYRDHLVHQVRVWVLGLYLIGKITHIREALIQELLGERDEAHLPSLSEKEVLELVLRRWKIASLWHDIGYVFEVQNSNEADELIANSFAKLYKQYGEPLSHLLTSAPALFTIADEINVKNAAESYGIPLSSFTKLTAFDQLIPHGHIAKWKTLRSAGKKSNLTQEPLDTGGFREYFDLCKAGSFASGSTKRHAFIDHGIASAILLLHLHNFMMNYTRSIVDIICDCSIQLPEAVKKRITDLKGNTTQSLPSIEAAARAIALHNILPSLIHPDIAPTKSLSLSQYKIYLTDGAHPHGLALAYLLILADGLQEWDRPTLKIPEKPRELTIIDQEFIVTASDTQVYVEYLPRVTADPLCAETVDFEVERLTKFQKIRNELSQVLDGIKEKPALIELGIAPSLTETSIEEKDRQPEPAGNSYDIEPYLRAVLKECGTIPMRGIMALGKARKTLEVPIQDIYASLRVEGGYTDTDLWYVLMGKTPLDRSERFERQLSDRKSSRRTSNGLLLVGEPGSGKSTFLRLTATALARALLHEPGAEAAEAVSILRDREGTMLLPIYIRLSEFTAYVQRNKGRYPEHAPMWLRDYLCHWIASFQIGIPETQFEQWLKAGRMLLLLDGLDEIPNSSLRDAIGQILSNAFEHKAYGRCRVCITSRPLPEEEFRVPLERHILTGLSDQAIETFLCRWSEQVNRDVEGKKLTPQEYTQDLLTQVRRADPSIRRMVHNPLMLTCLAVIHWHERRLPQQRGELFDAVITWLLRASKTRISDDNETPHLEEYNARNAYKKIAIYMQNDPEGRKREIPLEEAAREIAEYFTGAAVDKYKKACLFLNKEIFSTGIITMRGENQVSFWHLTFQEYLAAEYLNDTTEEELYHILSYKTIYDREWREVVLLLGSVMGASSRTNKLMSYIVKPPTQGLADQARAFSLGIALATDLKPYGYTPPPELGLGALEKNVMQIFTEAGTKLSLKLRVEAAEALGQAVDPRLKKDNWVRIPNEAFKDWENPPAEFYMGAYQVTVEEFAQFVDEGGYDLNGFGNEWVEEWRRGIQDLLHDKNYDFWRDEAKADLNRTEPASWKEQLNTPNVPVVHISWYEARAYCRWLMKRQNDGYEYRLLTEAEWELAARGQLKGKKYPWGNESPGEGDKARANYRGTGIGAPCPVGLFPTGATRWIGDCLLYDMAGNVWEWCEDEVDSNLNSQVGGLFRPLRGGSFWRDGGLVAVDYRCRSHATYRRDDCGFRVCRVLLSPRPAQDH